MLFTVSDKWRVWRAGSLILLFAYIALLYFDFNSSSKLLRHKNNILRLHTANVTNMHAIKGFIFGGSNASTSLSARDLSRVTAELWYNASVDGELDNIDSYNSFILNIAAATDKFNAYAIVYSSVMPYFPGSIALYRRRRNVGTREVADLELRPQRSGINYISEYFFATLNPPREMASNTNRMNEFGDVDMSESNCYFPEYLYPFKTERIDISATFLAERFIFLATAFPNAFIYMTLPSMYRGTATPDSSAFEMELREAFFKAVASAAPSLTQRAILIFQPNYPTITYVCNDPHHAVPAGRTWRTGDLIRRLVVHE